MPAGAFIGIPSPMNIAAVYRCVNVLADSVANLPIQVMRRSSDIFVEDTDSELYDLLNVQPSPTMSAVDFWQMIVRYLLLRGNAYVIPIADRLHPELIDKLVLVSPETVSHDTLTDTYTVNDHVQGIVGVYDEAEIIHIKNYSLDGKTGLSTLSYAAKTANIASTADDETLSRFANGGGVRGLVSNASSSVRGFGEYQDDELKRLSDEMESKFRAGRRIYFLPGQSQFTQMALSSADMQFLETKKLTNKDICRFFGVPPEKIYEDGATNYKSAEHVNVAFLTESLNPLLRKIELELLRKLVPRRWWRKRLFMFDRTAFYSSDLEGKSKYMTSQLTAGVSTVNELRRKENKPPVANGDIPLVSANLKTLTELLNEKNQGNGQE